MDWIAAQSYIKIERKVNSIEQVDTEHERMMYLCKDKLLTKHREFPIDEILDMSFRKIGNDGGGILYLHTIKGVFAYPIKQSPDKFIAAFRLL